MEGFSACLDDWYDLHPAQTIGFTQKKIGLLWSAQQAVSGQRESWF
jgi:hypothetical protein